MTGTLKDDARQIWQAGVDAVRSEPLVQKHVSVSGDRISISDLSWSLSSIHRIVVVGAGKAGAGMAAGFERALGPDLLGEKQVTGWINVPENCVRPLQRIHLHAARPAGRNEPTLAGQQGTNQILQLVRSLGPSDLCVCLISGGGSALMPAPIAGVSLDDKLQVTRFLSGAGANIQQLNAVRKSLSAIKGGGLARECRAGQLVTLIISDVMGDPLSVIASGPTVVDEDPRAVAAEAIKVLDQFNMDQADLPDHLRRIVRQALHTVDARQPTATVENRVIGNNRTALAASIDEAKRRGYNVQLLESESASCTAEEVGRQLADTMSAAMEADRLCFISGGEPVVKLVPRHQRGLGGRNQQLVLAGLIRWLDENQPIVGRLLLSGGTDGEDGPTDAAGGFVDDSVARRMQQLALDPASFLRRNDAYHLLEATGGLIQTGPTDTNVCDVRVGLLRHPQFQS